MGSDAQGEAAGRRAVVTGGAGFIGSHVVDALVRAGWAVDVVDNLSSGSAENLDSARSLGGDAVVLHELDVCSGDLVGLFERRRPALVCHLAAQIDVASSVADPRTDATINVLGTIAVLEAARAGPCDGEPYETWAARVLAAFDSFRLLCAVHDGPWGDVAVNDTVEQALAAQGWIAPRQPMYLGRPLIATRNDRDLGVFNGDVGVVLPDPQRRGALRAYFAAAGGVRSIAAARLHAVQTAYAMTVHKSQGSEFEHTVLVLPDRALGLSRELVYTAVTRARERVSVVGAQREVLGAAIARRVQRSSGLRERLDVPT